MNFNRQLWDNYKSLFYSIIFHIALLILIYSGIPNLSKPPTEELIISLEDLQISNISNVKEQSEQKENKEIKEVKSNREVLKSATQEAQEISSDKKDEEKPKLEERIKPDIADFSIKDKKEVKKENKESLEKSKDDKKQKDIKKTKDKVKQDQKKGDSDNLDALLKTLEDSKIKNTNEAQKIKNTKTATIRTTKTAKGIYNSNLPLSMNERDSIANQIYNAWYFQAGAKDSKDMFVVLKVELDISGGVTNIAIEDLPRYNRADAAYRVFVDSAIRAVKKASPFNNLSQDRYDTWSELELNFDPRGVIF